MNVGSSLSVLKELNDCVIKCKQKMFNPIVIYLILFKVLSNMFLQLANSYVIRRLAQLTHYGYRQITAWGKISMYVVVKDKPN